MEGNVKRVTLNMVNRAEDVPRVIRAYLKLKGAEATLVLRPSERRAILVRMENGEARVWNSHAGTEDGQGRDVPRRPETPIDQKTAVQVIKEIQKGLPKPGPITLRGMWRGYFYCDNGTPRVELIRKLATYGTLRIVSDPEKGWMWEFERAEKWFSKPGSDKGTTDYLVAAMEQGLANAMGLLGKACSMRDSHRRAAFDSEWAEKHPIKPAVETRNPTERLKPKEPKKKRTRSRRKTSTTKATPETASSPTMKADAMDKGTTPQGKSDAPEVTQGAHSAEWQEDRFSIHETRGNAGRYIPCGCRNRSGEGCPAHGRLQQGRGRGDSAADRGREVVMPAAALPHSQTADTTPGAEALLQTIVQIMRANLPRGVPVSYFDAFVRRNRRAMRQVLEQQLAAIASAPSGRPARPRANGAGASAGTVTISPTTVRTLAELWTPGERTRANLRAMEILAAKSPQTLTDDDRTALALYSGWGGLSIEKVRDRMPEGLPAPESRGLIHDFFTPRSNLF